MVFIIIIGSDICFVGRPRKKNAEQQLNQR
jgi:hypothetical protein